MGLFKTKSDENWKINYIKEFNEMRAEYEKKILAKQNEIDELKKQIDELKSVKSNLKPKEKQIKEVIDTIHNADILIYGIGNAIHMAKKRGLSEEYISKLQELGAVGEAFGCYFNKNSEVVSENTPIGININDAKKINTHIAVAAGENKVEAIIAAEMNNSNAVLVTDEAAGRKIAELIKLNK